jgi:hypothetical protein
MLGQNVARWPIFVPIAAIVVSIACIAHESFALPEIFGCRSWVRWFRKSDLAESGEPLPATDKLLVELRLRRMEPGERLAAFNQGK